MVRSASRNLLLSVLALALLTAGCGGRKSVAFAQDMQEPAKGLSAAIAKKDMKSIDRLVTAAERFRTNNKMAQDELDAFKYAADLCKKDQWDAAKAYIDRCLADSKM